MPASPISRLPADQQQGLLDDLNYLNIAEIKSLCQRHSIPYTIAIETKDGRRRKTNEADRKGVILNRIRHFLHTGVILEETRLRATVVVLTHFLKSSHRTTGCSTDHTTRQTAR
jgi:hypothetical protein